MADNNKPVIVKKDGAIKVSVWLNNSTNGPYFSANLERSFMKDEQWHTTTQLSGTDMLKASRLLQLAYDETVQLKSTHSSAATPAEA